MRSISIRAAAAMLAALVPMAAAADTPVTPDAVLQRLIAHEWQWELREDPLFATTVGVHDFDDRLPAESLTDHARRADQARAFLRDLQGIDRSRLQRPDQVSHEMLRRRLFDRIEEHRFGGHLVPLNADSGFHSQFARLPQEMSFATVRDYESYLARLRAFPRYMDEHIARMREGLRRGITLPRVALTGVDGTVRTLLVESAEKSVFWKPFETFPASVPAAEHERLRKEGRRAILESIGPAYVRFRDFMAKDYLPGARTTLGASALPDGRAWYDHLVRHFTTLDDVDAERVHAIGLREVERIRSEMDAVIAKTGFKGDFPAFLAFLRQDPRFYAKTPDALLKEAAFIAKRMDAKLPALFRTLPRLPYGVEPVPDYLAPRYTTGRYVPPAMGSAEPGYYWVNTYALEKRPLYNLEALTLHEAVPGHHLQTALAREREGLPMFRRFSYEHAFGEGWGLYSERLGIEAGFYTDPYSDFGRLSYEMWRACRLVVDTGLHAKGWTREQAIEYLASRTALPLHEVETETDRYISWPGQALAYKMGELKIRELRRRAEERLGARFDVRDFHDAVLLDGSVPLTVLEEGVERYIERTAAR